MSAFQNDMNLYPVKMSKKSTIIPVLFFLIHCFVAGQGSAYTGLYKKSPSLRYVDTKNLIIEGLEIVDVKDPCIALYGCSNITIRNCKLGPAISNLGIYLYRCSDITITNCVIENVASGMIASTCTGNIRFEYNDVKNILGYSRGGEKSWGQMVQFISVSGAGNTISYNVCENVSGESAPEDIINLFNSHGRVESPIRVVGNWLKGGGPSESGGGINLGDNGGSYQTAEENILVDPGQYGIGISGGDHLKIKNNKIVGNKLPFSNVGITVCNWYTNEDVKCQDIEVADNEINYVNKNGEANPLWSGGNCGKIDGWETNLFNRELNASILPPRIWARAHQKPPVWTPGWPAVSAITSDGFTLCVNLLDKGNSYYVILPAGSASPTSAQIKEGRDTSGKPLGWNVKGKIKCDIAQTEYEASIPLLAENKSYDIWFTVENPEYCILGPPVHITVNTLEKNNTINPVSGYINH